MPPEEASSTDHAHKNGATPPPLTPKLFALEFVARLRTVVENMTEEQCAQLHKVGVLPNMLRVVRLLQAGQAIEQDPLTFLTFLRKLAQS